MAQRTVLPTALAGRPVLLVAALAVILGGCSNASPTPSDASAPTPSPAAAEEQQATPSASSTNEEAAVLRQYDAYWPAVSQIVNIPISERKNYLDDYATNPALDRNISGSIALNAKQRGLYGAAVTRPTVVSIKGDVATVRDCQDASNDGQVDLRTGKKLTKGTPRAPVDATLRRGPDAVWRVSTVSFPKRTC